MFGLEVEIQNLVDQVRIKLPELKFRLTPRLDFEFLSKFVRAKKYNVDKSVDAVHRYYEHIYRNLDRIKGIKPSDYKEITESLPVVVFQHKVDGTRVAYSRVKNWDTSKLSLNDFLNFGTLMVEELITDEVVQVNGGIVIIDLEGLGYSHVREFISDIRYAATFFLDGIPVRVSALHIINAPRIYSPVHKVVMKLVPDKFGKRIHIHNSLDSLHEHVCSTKLPTCLGGSLTEDEAVDNDLIRKLMKYDICYDDIWNGDLPIQELKNLSYIIPK